MILYKKYIVRYEDITYRSDDRRLGDIPNKHSEDDVMDWMGAYTKIVRRNVKTDDAVAKLTKLMRDNGIAFFVFKEQK